MPQVMLKFLFTLILSSSLAFFSSCEENSRCKHDKPGYDGGFFTVWGFGPGVEEGSFLFADGTTCPVEFERGGKKVKRHCSAGTLARTKEIRIMMSFSEEEEEIQVDEEYPLIPTDDGYVIEATASLDPIRYPGPVTYSVRYVDEDPKTNLGFLEIERKSINSYLVKLRLREVTGCGVKREVIGCGVKNR